jgi:alpha-ketoglutarate-dependent taurine dioxygenase
MQFSASMAPPASPFDPGDEATYARWRAAKLAAHPTDPTAIRVPVRDPLRLEATERARILDACRRANMAIYAVQEPDRFDRRAFWALARQLGLTRFDRNLCADEEAVSALEVRSDGPAGEYIPYTDRRLGWHTDGYYNEEPRRIRAFLLHCVRAAAEGGVNELLDPEIAYIYLRDENPDFVRALMAPDAMRVPANVQGGRVLRAAFTGPVLAVEPGTGNLVMRYTERSRFVQWRDDRTTRAAIGFLAELLRSEIPYKFRYRLAPGEGLINNNVLHNRSAFRDPPEGPGRLLWRARSHDRVAGTSWRAVLPSTDQGHDHVMAE